MKNLQIAIRPAPSLRELAERSCERMIQSEGEKERIAGSFRQGYWWAVWESGKLRIKRQQTRPPGAAFGCAPGAAATLTLGAPIIEYDGKAITTTALSGDDPTLDEALGMMIELAKLLKEQSRESGWACVEVSGAPRAVQKLKERLKKDMSAPEVYDAEVAAALERSRGDRR